MVGVEDWRTINPLELSPLLAAEADAWLSELDWDVRDAWQPVEPARAAGRLPGAVVRDRTGRLTGWACFLLHRHALQVAMLVSDDPAATSDLLDAIVGSPEAAQAEIATVCVRDRAPGLREGLRARGFDVATYRYLAAPIGAWQSSTDRLSTWQPPDLEPMTRLCERAYEDGRDVRAFAPLGTRGEWVEYVAGLVAGRGCGRLMPHVSYVARRPDSPEFDGAILTTHLGARTAHIAQLAVDPSAQRRGMATALIGATMGRLRPLGFRAVTLLVSEGNARAAAIYDRFGFRDRAAFVVATSRQPRRLRSVALATGGVRTRL